MKFEIDGYYLDHNTRSVYQIVGLAGDVCDCKRLTYDGKTKVWQGWVSKKELSQYVRVKPK